MEQRLNYTTVKDVPIKSYVEESVGDTGQTVLNTYDVSTAFGSGFEETTAPLNLPQHERSTGVPGEVLSLKKS